MRSGFQSNFSIVALWVALCVPFTALAADRSWVERSDRNSAIVFGLLGRFAPEQVSEAGAEQFDTVVPDFKPGRAQRFDGAASRALALLSARRKTETDANRERHEMRRLVEPFEEQCRESADNQQKSHCRDRVLQIAHHPSIVLDVEAARLLLARRIARIPGSLVLGLVHHSFVPPPGVRSRAGRLWRKSRALRRTG